MEKKTKRRQIIAIFLVLAVLLAACSVSVTYYVKNYIPEGTAEPAAELPPSKTKEPDKSGFSAYLSDVLVANTYDSSRVKTDLSANVSIDRDSVTLEGSGADADTAKYIVSSLSGRICECYPSHEGEFGDKSDLFPAFALNGDDITDFEFKQGEVNPDDEGTKNETDFYYFTAKTDEFEIIDSPAVSQHGFPCYSAADLKPAIYKVTDSLAEMIDVTDCEIKANGSEIDGKTNRLNDQLQYLNLSTDYSVKLSVSFKGDYAALGKAVLSFNLSVEQKYNYTWAGVDITEDEIRLTLNEDESLPLSVSLSDKATEKDYKISFESENEKSVSVDGDGKITGLSLGSKPVKVKVIFEYLGNTYTDSCDVYVTIPVKRIKTQPSKMTLSVGENKKLSCEIAPDDATVRDIEWHSEDDSIAAVSDDGTVTAVGKGTVRVYAVSLDGYMKSSCAVTVEEVK